MRAADRNPRQGTSTPLSRRSVTRTMRPSRDDADGTLMALDDHHEPPSPMSRRSPAAAPATPVTAAETTIARPSSTRTPRSRELVREEVPGFALGPEDRADAVPQAPATPALPQQARDTDGPGDREGVAGRRLERDQSLVTLAWDEAGQGLVEVVPDLVQPFGVP